MARHHMQDRWDEAAREHQQMVERAASHEPGKEWVTLPGNIKGWTRNPHYDELEDLI